MREELQRPNFRFLFALIMLGLNVLSLTSHKRGSQGIGYWTRKLAQLELLDRHSPADKQYRTRVLVFADPEFLQMNRGLTLHLQLMVMLAAFFVIWLLIALISLFPAMGYKIDVPFFDIHI